MASGNFSDHESWSKLWAMVKDIKTAMLTSLDGDVLRSRPMTGQADSGDGQIWFFTKLHSGKTHEIQEDGHVNLAYADTAEENYVSIAGRARITRDRAKIDQFWNPFVAAWFPGGKDDPEVAMICVQVDSAEYWDSPSSTMVRLYEIAKANVTGREPQMGENVKLTA